MTLTRLYGFFAVEHATGRVRILGVTCTQPPTGWRRELLDRILILNQRHAAVVLTEYERRFNEHRPDRGLGQAAPLRALPDPHSSRHFRVIRRDRLGGLLHEYAQVA